jgi:cyanate permease
MPALSIPALFVCGLGMGFNGGGNFAIGQTLAGPRAAPRWIGLQNLCGNIAGMVGPAITGWLIDSAGGFLGAFVVAALVTLTGALAWGVIIPKVAPVDWGWEAAAG